MASFEVGFHYEQPPAAFPLIGQMDGNTVQLPPGTSVPFNGIAVQNEPKNRSVTRIALGFAVRKAAGERLMNMEIVFARHGTSADQVEQHNAVRLLSLSSLNRELFNECTKKEPAPWCKTARSIMTMHSLLGVVMSTGIDSFYDLRRQNSVGMMTIVNQSDCPMLNYYAYNFFGKRRLKYPGLPSPQIPGSFLWLVLRKITVREYISGIGADDVVPGMEAPAQERHRVAVSHKMNNPELDRPTWAFLPYCAPPGQGVPYEFLNWINGDNTPEKGMAIFVGAHAHYLHGNAGQQGGVGVLGAAQVAAATARVRQFTLPAPGFDHLSEAMFTGRASDYSSDVPQRTSTSLPLVHVSFRNR